MSRRTRRLQSRRQLAVVQADQEKAATPFDLSSMFYQGNEIPYTNSGVYYGLGSLNGAYSNSWVAYACIKRMAIDTAGVPLMFLNDRDDPESKVSDNHPVKRLFEHPNNLFTTNEFKQWLITVLNMRGETFTVFDNPIFPTEMVQYTEPTGWKEKIENHQLVEWDYQTGGEQLKRSPEELIHHRFINPDNRYRGQTPLQAAASAYRIDQTADTLQESVLGRGGERSILYQTELSTTKPQREQMLAALKRRRAAPGVVAKDTLLPNGVSIIDPRFIEDDLSILNSQEMQPDKICAVYGCSKSLLGFEDIDKYATFLGRVKVYWHQTMIPMLTGVEGSWDSFFPNLSTGWRCYVRFDYSKVIALQADLKELFEIAGVAHDKGIPWTVLNERFPLGLDVDKIPGADTIMVPSIVAPLDQLIAEWSSPADTVPAGDEGGKRDGSSSTVDDLSPDQLLANGATVKATKQRITDPRGNLQRTIRLQRLERKLKREWRAFLTKVMHRATRAVKREPSDVIDELKVIKQDGPGHFPKYHVAGAEEGEMSIIDLSGKLDHREMAAYKSMRKFRRETISWMSKRKDLIKGMCDGLYDDVLFHLEAATEEGVESSKIVSIIRDRLHKAAGGINQAVTIARTEVGTAYNSARFAEMGAQKFELHEWIDSGDDLVREGHGIGGEVVKVGDEFSNGLRYPQDPNGEPGNVINCRCETIPHLPEE